MRYTAKHNQADVGARKIRPFAQLIRGRNVDDALEQLRYIPNRGAKHLAAVVKSAVGNAEDRGCQNIDELVVTEARIDDAPMFKRIRPRARGTAFMIKRRMSHIIVALTDYEDLHPEAADVDYATGGNQPALITTPVSVTNSGDDAPAEGDAGHQDEEKAPTTQEVQEPDGDDAPAAEGNDVSKSDESNK